MVVPDGTPFLSLSAGDRSPRPGWCSYAPQLQSPDIEVLANGLNSKAKDAAALWRQGHLLHFGFDLAPIEMNDNGRALLVNAIVYIAGFREDRALLRAASPFAGAAPRSRTYLRSWIEDDAKADWVRAAIDPTIVPAAAGADAAALRDWFWRVEPWLHPGPDARLTVDDDARALGVRYDEASFFPQAIAALAADPATAGRVLRRYAPDGPESDDREVWRAWHAANAPYLFYAEFGGFRWYVDSLARDRGVPSATLSGPARRDRATAGDR